MSKHFGSVESGHSMVGPPIHRLLPYEYEQGTAGRTAVSETPDISLSLEFKPDLVDMRSETLLNIPKHHH